ncbi:MAG: chromate efflux transporter [Acidimicrobiales bacterium]
MSGASGRHLGEIAGTMLRIGSSAFGGPAAHVGLLHDEFVKRRHWVDEQEFVDGLGITSVLPGPGSTQLAMLLGRRRGGIAGLVVAGTCFIAPAFVLVAVVAWAYVHNSRSPVTADLRVGLEPVVVAVIADALVALSRTALRSRLAWLVAASAVAGYLFGLDVLLVIAAGAAVCAVVERGPEWLHRGRAMALTPLLMPGAAGAHMVRPRLAALFGEFLKLGIVVFGSGYVLLAYLRQDLVAGLGWLTTTQLLYAVAVGQFTPGPVFTAATFIGYLLGGLPGAVFATVAIFLPSFVMVTLAGPLVLRMRRGALGAALLDGVNAAALGVMAGVTVQLARAALVSPFTCAVAVAALVLVVLARVNVAWVLLGGAALGLLHAYA